MGQLFCQISNTFLRQSFVKICRNSFNLDKNNLRKRRKNKNKKNFLFFFFFWWWEGTFFLILDFLGDLSLPFQNRIFPIFFCQEEDSSCSSNVTRSSSVTTLGQTRRAYLFYVPKFFFWLCDLNNIFLKRQMGREYITN